MPVVAYNNFDNECWWTNPSGANLIVQWKWGPNINTAGGWANDYRLGADAWNNAGTKLRQYYNASAVDTADTYYAIESRPAYTNWYCNLNWTMANNNMFGNTYVFSDAGTDACRRGAALHEFGHASGMGHSSVDPSAMNGYVNQCLSTPQTDDVTGLNAMYPW